MNLIFDSSRICIKDIQIPVKLCIEYLNELKVQGKPYEYAFFPSLGHNTSSASISAPVDIAIQWIKHKSKEHR